MFAHGSTATQAVTIKSMSQWALFVEAPAGGVESETHNQAPQGRAEGGKALHRAMEVVGVIG